MNAVYEITKPLRTNFHTFSGGEKLYKEPLNTHGLTGNNYYPFSGGYPLWDKQIDVENYATKIFDTDKPREYYIDKVYTQERMDIIMRECFEAARKQDYNNARIISHSPTHKEWSSIVYPTFEDYIKSIPKQNT